MAPSFCSMFPLKRGRVTPLEESKQKCLVSALCAVGAVCRHLEVFLSRVLHLLFSTAQTVPHWTSSTLALLLICRHPSSSVARGAGVNKHQADGLLVWAPAPSQEVPPSHLSQPKCRQVIFHNLSVRLWLLLRRPVRLELGTS